MPIVKRELSIPEFILAVGLILILAGVAIWAINPIERLKRNRDHQRLADLENLKTAIEAANAEGIPMKKTYGVPESSASVGSTRNADGTGWLEMNLSSQISTLPSDPKNGETFTDVGGSSVTGEYQFISDGNYYVLRTHLEAEANKDTYASDGNDNSWYEIGNAPGLSSYFGL